MTKQAVQGFTYMIQHLHAHDRQQSLDLQATLELSYLWSGPTDHSYMM